MVTPYALQSTYRDYFGTIVTTFDLQDRHRQLEVVAEATVETFHQVDSGHALDVRNALSAAPWTDQLRREYLAPTARTSMSSEVLERVSWTRVSSCVDPRDVADAADVVGGRAYAVRARGDAGLVHRARRLG